MFGISCAPEIFQKVMESIVAGLDGVVVYLDDVMVVGRSQEEHDRRLENLLKRFEQYGVLLNKKKCIYNASRIEFLGHELSNEGFRPTESKIDAIRSFREPRNVSELRSFLGLITYIGRFIPHLADKTEPLRVLLRTGNIFKWTDEHQDAFDKIKSVVCQTDFLGYFNPKDLCIVIADASPTGLGAVLLQQNRSYETRIITFASKALTDVEKKYFQTEKEALALVWAVDKFHLYLLGKRFRLVTDCKPLQFLFKERTKPNARIERWVLRLQAYSFDVVYEPGAKNLADSISRLSIAQPIDFDVAGEACIYQVARASIPEAITLEQVCTETVEDETLQNVITSLETGIWDDKTKDFKAFNTQLCQSGNLLLRGDRLVLPEVLRHRTLEIAHESHPGMVAMKRRLRQKVWWPKMDSEVESFVRKCKACTLVSAPDHPEPLKRAEMPQHPWVDIAADFVGPLPSGHNLFVLIDYYSRFTEIIIMKQITATLTVRALHETFCRFGMPESLKTDNGPQFISGELQQFCKQFGIEHRRTTPYWPQANGEVERINRSIGKRLKISQETEGADWQWDLRMFVLMHNSTPHSTTGVAPSSLMFGRILRDKLPGLMEKKSDTLEEIHDRDRVNKQKGAEYANERRNAQASSLEVGDTVITKRIQKENKLSTPFNPEEFVILERKGSQAVLKSKDSDRLIHRNTSHLKKLFTEDQQQGNSTLKTQTDVELPALNNQDQISDQTSDQTSDQALDQTLNQTLDQTSDQRTMEPQKRLRRITKPPSYLQEYKVNQLI